MNQANAYAAFMLDYAAGRLTPAERLVGDLHRVLSTTGGREARFVEAVGGAMLEAQQGAEDLSVHMRMSDAPAHSPGRVTERVRQDYSVLRKFAATGDLRTLDWRRDIFGMSKAGLETPMAHVLRLEPGKKAPRHAHGRQDVTLVLKGAFSDEYGQYERGDITFAGPGLRHTPEAIGEETCVCLLATEPGRPLLGFLGLFGFLGPAPEARKHVD